jgi:hypothetical protein
MLNPNQPLTQNEKVVLVKVLQACISDGPYPSLDNVECYQSGYVLGVIDAVLAFSETLTCCESEDLESVREKLQ